MYKECKTAQSRERQKKFTQTLLKMLEKQPYKEITVSSLCREMGAPRKAFYRYFDGIEDVLNAFFDELLFNAFRYMGRIEVEPEKFFQYWKDQKQYLDILEKNGMSQKLLDRSLEAVLAGGAVESLSNRDMKYAGYISAFMTLVIVWHHSGMKQSVGEMTGLVVDMFMRKSGL